MPDNRFEKYDLSSLTKEEKDIVIKILDEYTLYGNSDTFKELQEADYKEIPVDIETFLTDDRYLGKAWKDASGKSKLYPFWLEKLKILFPDPYTTSVNNFIESGSRGQGKMNPIDTPVLTKDGFIPMGEVKVGTEVYGRDGKLHTVSQIFPHGYKDIYEVSFSDGTTSECGLEHLWQVIDHHVLRKHKYCPPETRIIDTEYLTKITNFSNRFEIPMCEAIQFPEQEVPIPPYILGLLLGDGCFSTNNISLTTAHEEIKRAFEEYVISDSNNTYYLCETNKKSKSKAKGYRISNTVHNSTIKNIYVEKITELGLYNKKSHEKFIPKKYLYNNRENRLALLQGLLDTDGTIGKDKRNIYNNINYCTVSEQLKDDVVWLVQSLGGTARVSIRPSKYKNAKGEIIECKPHYRISIKIPTSMPPFRLSRKLDLYNSSKHIEPVRYIKGVRKLPQKKEAQCIYIDDDEHLYLVNDFIVTHNSEIAAGACCSYLLYRVMCLKDPLEYFGLKPTEKICFAFVNITKASAEEIALDKFQKTIQLSPWFLSRGILRQRNNEPYWEPPDPIEIIIGSQPSDVIGRPIYACFADEVSFMRNQDIEKQKAKALDLIDTAIGGMKTRFIKDGKNPTLLILASSKRSEKSFLEEHMKKKVQSEGDNVLIVDEPVWNVKPKGTYSERTFNVALGNKYLQSQIIPDEDNVRDWVDKGFKIIKVPIDFRSDFIEDIDRALCDFAGISSSEINKYISGAALSECIYKDIENPFTREVLEIGNGPEDTQQYYDSFDLNKIPPEMKTKPLFIHLDMSISGDKTGIAGVWIKGKKTSTDSNQSNDLFYQLAFSVSIKAPKGRQISFEKNRNFIYWLKEQGFAIKGITTDTFQSYDTGQALTAKGYNYSILSVDKVTDQINKPYQYFKSTIYEKRFKMYPCKLLQDEIIDLERNINTGKVDHPSGACFTGETEVSLVDGRTLNFYDLVKEYEQGKVNYVYSMNLDTRKIEPKPITKAWLTQKDQPLVRVTLDNGKWVECTLNHKFMLRDGTYIEAKDLLPGDSLMPLYTKISTKGLEGYRMYYEPFENRWRYEHRVFATEVDDEKYLVHHKNANKLDNTPPNLIWMSKARHIVVHSNNGIGQYSPEANKKRKDSLKQYAETHPEDYAERGRKISEKLKDRYAVTHDGIRIEDKIAAHIKEIEDTFGVDYSKLSQREKNSYGIQLAMIKDPDIATRISNTLSQRHKEGRFENAKKALQAINDKNKFLKKLFPEIDYEEFEKLFGFSYFDIEPRKRPPWATRYRQKLYDIKNHKVVSIEFINKRADVYDIEVQDNHNFALACGVFVHNSKDQSDAVCGAIFNASSHAEEYAFEYGEDVGTIFDANENSLAQTEKEIIDQFEKELTNTLTPKANPSFNNTAKRDEALEQQMYLMDGIFI